MSRIAFICLLFIIHISGSQSLTGQVGESIQSYLPPVKVIESNSPEPGYFFISSRVLNTDTALHFAAIVDNYGTLIYYRRLYLGNGGFRLQKNGYLTYRPNWTGFGYFVIDSSYNRIDTLYMLDYNADQHDFKISEDGHPLFIGNYNRSVDMSRIVEGGNPDATVVELVIQEFDSVGNLVFEWKSEDHFDILDGNDKSVNFNSSIIDYIHTNGIEFDSDTSILISSRHLDEITKIDRRTGDIIWRLGGKRNQFTFINDTIGFSCQHSIVKLDNGNILLFDNGNYNTPQFSSAVEYAINEELMTATLVKRYRPYFDVYAWYGCNTQKLQGGNILLGLGEASPSLIELRPDNSVALIMDFSEYALSLLITKHPWKTNLFTTNTDTIIFPKYEYTTYYYQLRLFNNSDKPVNITGYSTHTSSFYIDENFPITIPAKSDTIISVAFKPVTEGYVTDVLTINSDIVSDTLIQRIARQVYLEGTSDDLNPPVANISPSDEIRVPLDTKVYFEFNEPVRYVDDSDINYTNIKSILTFKETDVQGEDVDYIVKVSTDKKLITLIPTATLKEEQLYYVSVANGLEDYSDNQADVFSAGFTTGELQPPRVDFDPEDGSIDVPTIMQAIVNFDEPVRLIDNREIDDTNTDSLIIFRESSGQMNQVPFEATINSGKTLITIVPESELESYTEYVIIVRNLEDYCDNTLSGNSARSYFTTGPSEHTSVISSEPNAGYVIYPNPSNGEFVINFGSIGTRKIEVFDFTGNYVYNAISNTGSHIVDLDNLSPGIYFIKIIKLNSSENTLLKVISK